MLRCKELVHLVTAEHPAALPIGRRLAVGMHLAMCRHCRAWVRGMRRLRASARRVWLGSPGPDQHQRQRLRQRLTDALEAPSA